MKKIIAMGLLVTTTSFLFGQKPEDLLTAKEAERIEKVLSSDEMRGRKTFSPEIDKAADFIANEFKIAGLKAWDGKNFRQEFSLVNAKQLSLEANLDGVSFDAKNVVMVTEKPEIIVNSKSGFETATIARGDNLFSKARGMLDSGKDLVVWVDTSFSKSFPRLSGFKRGLFKSGKTAVFILAPTPAKEFSITAKHEVTEQKLANVVGILPGKSLKNEYVIFSGHYDHIGVGKPVDGDSIYNGANDDAAGTTAVIMLAKYFRALNNNERTIVFAAFTAEEIGGFGSTYFSKQYDPAKVMAMFNIEMIGTDSKWGKNAAYITGYEKTDMGSIMQKNLEGTGFAFHPDPYPSQNLFYRSDNATLARLGVPAHTISTSKMDNEPNYHKPSDELSTLDMDNMAMIIRAIALSSRSIVAGKETPTRVKEE